MRTPKAKKLKSGKWRVQIQIDNHRYSITLPTKKEAEKEAARLYAGIQEEKRSPLTVGKAIDKYIEEKTGVLSPSTIRGYKSIRKNYLQDLMDINISDLTQGDIQVAISNEAVKGKSSKTIRNAHGLLNSVLIEFRPEFTVRTRLPQKKPTEYNIFTEDEMKKVFDEMKGNKYELSILLAAWLGLRESEICGLQFGDVQNGRIHIQRAYVKGPDGYIMKLTKSESGDRIIKLPGVISHLIVLEKLKYEGKSEDEIKELRICPYAPLTIYKNFVNACKRAGVEPCTFHELRHFAASEAHSLGIPNKYMAKRVGHKTENMLQNVYQHTLRDKEDEFGDLIDEHMEKLYNK